MSTQNYQPGSIAPSTSMKEQDGVNEIPRDEGSDDDMPLPQQGFAVIGQQIESDDEGISSDDEGNMHNGYQLLSQEPEGPENDEEDSESHPTGSSEASAYSPEMMQQVAMGSSQSSNTHSHLPPHLANLMPTQIPQSDQSACVSYSDTKDTRESRKQLMAEDDKIKAAMAGFKLPSVTMPHWVNFVSEEDWKKNLVSRLDAKQITRQSGKDGDGSQGSQEKNAER